MAHDSQLPCDGDGVCMSCRAMASDEEKLTCKTCVTPWHVDCLSVRPQTLPSVRDWNCPDCSSLVADVPPRPAVKPIVSAADDASCDLVAAIRAIEADGSLTEQEKARKRQAIVSGKSQPSDLGEENAKKKGKMVVDDDVLDSSLSCSFCMQLLERPVTTPCGHNFCLKCFQKWIGQGKRTCAKCRDTIPPKIAGHPRINSTLVVAIRMAKISKSVGTGGQPKVYHFVDNQDRPDKAYTTERAKKNGNANAASGKIFVTVSPDHFGPILAVNDPERNQGVLVGECWEDRMECRQWGVHRTHISGIAGQSVYGAQSVALSGGYEDDEDHGEWFLYTGSGGRDLSGNKRTNKSHSFDQSFVKMNEALRVSCKKGYPVRVVRSHKEKRSSYAPEKGVRYDGIYRIEKCWRKVGIQGYKVCRYLFVRCDNEPAPWTSDEHGDQPRPLPEILELKQATDITERKESPSWDFDDNTLLWKWKKTPPVSRKLVDTGNPVRKRMRTARQKLPKDFYCSLCQKVMTLPVTTPCAHNFCKDCVQGAFAGKTFVRERLCFSGQALRLQKNVMQCPSCPADISEFLQNPQVNRDLVDLIQSLQCDTQKGGTHSSENFEKIDPVDCSLDRDDEKANESNAGDKSEDSPNGKKTVGRGRGRPRKNGGGGEGRGWGQVCHRPLKTSSQDGLLESNNGVKTGEKRGEEATVVEANDSPSSPLHVRSEEDDFE